MNDQQKSKAELLAELAALRQELDNLKRPSVANYFPTYSHEEQTRIYQKMLDSLPEAVSFVDKNYIYRIINSTYLRRTGLSREQIEGHHVAEIVGEETFLRVVKDKLDQCLHGETVNYTSWFTFGSQQSPHLLDVIYVPYYDDAQQIIGVLVSNRDVTDIFYAREEANAVLNTIPDLIFVVNREGRFLRYKTNCEDLDYQGEKGPVGLTIQQINPPHVSATIMAEIHATLETQAPRQFEYVLDTPKGKRQWECHMVPSESDSVTCMVRDITSQRLAEMNLRQSEAHFRAFMDNNPGFAFIKDKQNRHVYVNKAMLQFLKREEHEVLGRHAADFFVPEVARRLQENDVYVHTHREPIRSEEYLVLPSGETKWVQEVKFPIQQADGSILVGGVSIDITDIKKAEQTLREQEQRLRQLAENIEEVYWLYETANGRMVYVSPAYEKVIGQPVADFMKDPTHFVQMVHPEDRAAVEAAMKRQEEMGGYFNEEFRIIRLDGSVRWIRAQTFPVEDENGYVYRIAGVATDVTERHLTLEREQEQHRLARALAKSAQAINQTLQLDEVFQRILSSLAEVVPYEQATIVYIKTSGGQAQIVQPDKQIDLKEASATLLQLPQFELMRESREPLLIRDTAVFPNWQPLPENIPTRSYLGAPMLVGSEIIGFLNLVSTTPEFFNETHRQHLQAFVSQAAIAVQNARLHEKLQQQFSQLQQAQTRLVQSEKLAAIGELVAGIAHELNNPLTSIILFSQLLARRNVNQALVHDIEQIVNQAHRAGNIVRGLLDFARQRPPEQEQVSINDILRGTVEMMAYELRTRNVTAVLQLADLPPIVADPHLLQQVFVNLINNALQAMQAQGGGQLHISSSLGRAQFAPLSDEATPEVVRIQFTDTGPGISPELQARIFDPFFTTKPAGQGTGLGLSISHSIIHEHGGHLWVTSQPGEGATFFIELPLRTAVAPNLILPPSQQTPPAQQTKRARILVVDNEPGILHIIARILSEEYAVSLAENIDIARQKLTQEPHDLILCDVYMPGMDGLKFYRIVQQQYPQLAQRFIFSTGDTTRPALQEGLRETGAPILAKPFNLETLLQQVQQMLNEDDRPASHPSAFTTIDHTGPG